MMIICDMDIYAEEAASFLFSIDYIIIPCFPFIDPQHTSERKYKKRGKTIYYYALVHLVFVACLYVLS